MVFSMANRKKVHPPMEAAGNGYDRVSVSLRIKLTSRRRNSLIVGKTWTTRKLNSQLHIVEMAFA
jgi:hypothetical protein